MMPVTAPAMLVTSAGTVRVSFARHFVPVQVTVLNLKLRLECQTGGARCFPYPKLFHPNEVIAALMLALMSIS
jgi:hypothetical protein